MSKNVSKWRIKSLLFVHKLFYLIFTQYSEGLYTICFINKLYWTRNWKRKFNAM